MDRKRLGPVKGHLAVAVALEHQAKVLRAIAAGWQTSGTHLAVNLNGSLYRLHRITIGDLIDDACALEADAAKLRKLYS